MKKSTIIFNLHKESKLSQDNLSQQIKKKHADELIRLEQEYKKSGEVIEESALECNAIAKESVALRNQCDSLLSIIKSYQKDELTPSVDAVNDSQAYLARMEDNYKKSLEVQEKSTIECNAIAKESVALRNQCDSSLSIIKSYQNNEVIPAIQVLNNSQAYLASINRENYKSVVNEPIKHHPRIFFGIRDNPYYTDNWVTKYDDTRFTNDLAQAQGRLNMALDAHTNYRNKETQLISTHNDLRAKHESVKQVHIQKYTENQSLRKLSANSLIKLEEIRSKNEVDRENYISCKNKDSELISTHNDLRAKHESVRQVYIKKLAEHESFIKSGNDLCNILKEIRSKDINKTVVELA